MTPNTDNIQLKRHELAMWENDLAMSVNDLAFAEKYGDFGGTEWYKHKIQYAQNKILELTEYLEHARKTKGA